MVFGVEAMPRAQSQALRYVERADNVAGEFYFFSKLIAHSLWLPKGMDPVLDEVIPYSNTTAPVDC